CIEMFASGMVDLEALDKDVVFSKRTGYRNFLDKLSVAVDDIKEYDDSFYRTEKTLMRKSNDNMALGTYGLSGSTSTLNSETITFLNRMGYASKSHWTKYLGGNPVPDSLLGVKYLISGYDDEVYEVRDLFDYPEYSMKSYYNPYALSICTAVSVRLTNASFTDEGIKTPFERLNNLVSNMAGGDGSAVFSEASVSSVSTDNISVSSVAGHTKYAKIGSSPDARVNFRIHVESDDPLYCYFPSEYPRECDLTLNGKSAGTFFGNDTNRIVSLGTFKPGDNIVVTLSLKKDELYIWENESFFWYLDTKAFEKEFSLLTKGNMTVTSHTEDTICGTIDVASDRTQIFTSIPYDREVETAEVLDGLLTFSLSPGEHELRLEYRPAPFRNGVIISSLGVVSFILIAAGNRCLIAKCKKKKRRGSDNFN
ncbi:MAG: YfhO family protein, partial [Clostridia bacterium]|nr:YfhO family protein [Clostridia bacterium]